MNAEWVFWGVMAALNAVLVTFNTWMWATSPKEKQRTYLVLSTVNAAVLTASVIRLWSAS